MNKVECYYCGEDLQECWMRDMEWRGAVCYECYGSGGGFYRWLAGVLRKVAGWRRELGGL